MEIYDNEEEDRLYFEQQENTASLAQIQRRAKESVLPKVVEAYMRSAEQVSLYNPVPSAVSFYALLGQLCKDMVAIPHGRRIDDTRVQFLWMQTSGTGKSTLYDFFGPVSRLSLIHI